MSLTLRRLLAPAALLLLAWLGIMLSGPLQERPVAFVSLYALAFGAYAWAAWIVLRAGASERRLLIAVVAVGALARVIALPGAPSDDIHRYLWEAKVQRAGLDPYALAPDAPELAALAADDPDHPRVNHPSWTAIYPPGAQLWNRLFGRGVLALKLSYLVAEALALIALFFLLRARSLPASRALIYWWNPLPILAFAVEGHLDALTVAALTAALAALELSRTRTGAALLGAAALAKGLAVAVVPAYLRSVPPQRWLFAAAIGLAAWLPFRGAGTDISASLLRFGGELSYNDSLHEVASVVLATAGATAPAASRLVVAGLWLALAALVVLREHADPLRGAAILLGGALLLLPTAHAWYFTILIPLLAVFPWAGWIALTGTLALPYLAHLEIHETGTWVEWHGVKWLAYAPLFAWMLACAGRDVARRFRGKSEPALAGASRGGRWS